DAPLLVADDDERGEAEATTALHHLGDAIDVDELVDEFAVALFAVAAVATAIPTFLCHCPGPCSFPVARVSTKPGIAPDGETEQAAKTRALPRKSFSRPLEAEAGFARGVRQRLDAAVEDEGAAIEHDVLDARLDRALGDELADGSRRFPVGAGLERALQILVERRGGGDRMAARVVDDLRVDVLRRAMHRKTQTLARNLLQLPADTRRAALDSFLVGHGQYSLPCETGAAICGPMPKG